MSDYAVTEAVQYWNAVTDAILRRESSLQNAFAMIKVDNGGVTQ